MRKRKDNRPNRRGGWVKEKDIPDEVTKSEIAINVKNQQCRPAINIVEKIHSYKC